MSELQWLFNFKSPRNAVELAERVAEYASAEERWTRGTLCRLRPEYREAYEDEWTYTNSLKITEADDVELCKSVGACLMGIMAISFWNGKLVKSILGGKSGNREWDDQGFNEMASHGSVWNKGVRNLFNALPEDYRQRYIECEGEKNWVAKPLTLEQMVDCIEGYNDGEVEKHEEIVEVTQRALEIARG